MTQIVKSGRSGARLLPPASTPDNHLGVDESDVVLLTVKGGKFVLAD